MKNLDSLRDSYLSEFQSAYPQVRVEAHWSGSELQVYIRGDRQEKMTIDQVINAIATFQQPGRPVDKLGRICYNR